MPGRPPKDSAAHRLLFEDIDDVTTPCREFAQENIEAKLPTHFGEQFVRQAAERGLDYKLTPEERAEIEREIEEKGWTSLCRCTQADFKDADIGVRNMKATMVNLYFEYGGNWAKVFKDDRSCSRRAMAIYWRDDLFRAYIEALDPILMLEARGVVVEVWKDGVDEKARLAAALQFLQAYDAKQWDKGVRKQIVANKGSLQSALFNRVISDDEFINTFVKDRLNKLPDNVRAALEQEVKRPQVVSTEPVSTRIGTADMTKLQDPFDNQNDEEQDV